MSLPARADIVVVGAGIAGASAAAEMAAAARVVLVEREDAPGYHSTGRSAALWSATLGDAQVRALTVASREFLDAPPAGFADHPLLAPRGVLEVADSGRLDALDAKVEAGRRFTPSITRIGRDAALARVPVLRADGFAAAFWEPDAADIDVAALHQGSLRLAKARGATLALDAEVVGLDRSGADWRVATRAGAVTAPVVVDAAGAWADALAGLAGLAPLGIVPRRRTGLIVPLPAGMDARAWPLFGDLAETFYARPEAGRLMVSPGDATPSPPCDAQPDELDVALAIDRITRATTLAVPRVERAWAGLRSFAPDGRPVVGFDPRAPGFFWLAGQGGFGIQTAPAMATLAAALVGGLPVPGPLAERGIAADALAPDRLLGADA